MKLEKAYKIRLQYVRVSWSYVMNKLKIIKNRYETNRVGEAANHEYWRACKIRTAYEIKDLKEILQEIDVMMQEEVRDLEEADEDIRTLKTDATMGI